MELTTEAIYDVIHKYQSIFDAIDVSVDRETSILDIVNQSPKLKETFLNFFCKKPDSIARNLQDLRIIDMVSSLLSFKLSLKRIEQEMEHPAYELFNILYREEIAELKDSADNAIKKLMSLKSFKIEAPPSLGD